MVGAGVVPIPGQSTLQVHRGSFNHYTCKNLLLTCSEPMSQGSPPHQHWLHTRVVVPHLLEGKNPCQSSPRAEFPASFSPPMSVQVLCSVPLKMKGRTQGPAWQVPRLLVHPLRVIQYMTCLQCPSFSLLIFSL